MRSGRPSGAGSTLVARRTCICPLHGVRRRSDTEHGREPLDFALAYGGRRCDAADALNAPSGTRDSAALQGRPGDARVRARGVLRRGPDADAHVLGTPRCGPRRRFRIARARALPVARRRRRGVRARPLDAGARPFSAALRARPASSVTRQRADALAAFVVGLLLGNVGLCCPDPVFLSLIPFIAGSSGAGDGALLAAAYGLGRATHSSPSSCWPVPASMRSDSPRRTSRASTGRSAGVSSRSAR